MSDDTAKPVLTNTAKYEIAAANPKALARILGKVTYEGACWIWTGCTNGHGYACVVSNKQMVYGHRLTHWIVRGPIPDGMVLDHLCRNRACVNPMHTEVVTQLVNTHRGAGSASRTACPSGHPYDAENTRTWVDARGYPHRSCITCTNARNAARFAHAS